MTTEEKTEKAKAPAKKPAKKMTRLQAINMLVDYNQPFDQSESDAELVAKAKEIVPEPYYKAIIMDNGQTGLLPWAKVNNEMKIFERGKEVYIRQRFLNVLQEKSTVIQPGDEKSGGLKRMFKQAEVVQILEVLPEEDVPEDER